MVAAESGEGRFDAPSKASGLSIRLPEGTAVSRRRKVSGQQMEGLGVVRPFDELQAETRFCAGNAGNLVDQVAGFGVDQGQPRDPAPNATEKFGTRQQPGGRGLCVYE